MKRIISSLIIAVMLVSMFGFMTTGVSANSLKSTYEDAKDGDLLYEVKFGQTTGAYIPTQFNAQQAGDTDAGAVTITDDGRTLSYYKPSLTSKSSYYGGAIEGLTWGDGKVYTITMKLSLPENRGGVYFNFPTAAKQEELRGATGVNDNSYHSVMYGIYGRFTDSGDLGSMLGGSRIAGRFRFDTSSYKEFDSIIVEEGTFLDVTFLVEGYSYAIFVNNNFLDVIDLSEYDVKGISDNLGFSVYLYHIKENKPMIVKDVNIYKGDTVSKNAHYPSYIPKGCPLCTSISIALEESKKNTTTPEVTTPEMTTPEETTTASPIETTTKAPDLTTAPIENKGGCSSVVTSGVVLIALASLAGVTAIRKRK